MTTNGRNGNGSGKPAAVLAVSPLTSTTAADHAEEARRLARLSASHSGRAATLARDQQPGAVKPPQALKIPCVIPGCAKQALSRQYCSGHYNRWLRYGDPLAGRTRKDFDGQRFGCLVVVGDAVRRNGRRLLVRCDCGNEKEVWASDLVRRRTRSCGCEGGLAGVRTHGLSKHPLYAIWGGMHTRANGRRVLDPSRRDVKNYGARGIAICARWHEFENFYADMAPTWRKGLTLDRIDSKGDYEPSNCRWATQKEQQRNRRSNRLLETKWGKILLVEAAELAKIHRVTITRRLERGWSVNDALARAPRLRRRRDALGLLVQQ